MPVQENSDQAFYAKISSLIALCGGGGLLLASLLAIPSSPIFPGAPILIACALIVAGLWFQFNPVVRLTDEHVSVKLAIIRPRTTLALDQLARVEATPRECVLYYRKARSGEGKLKIPLKSLAKEDRERCTLALQQRVHTEAA
ncbi:hypothetical protein EVC62_18780 [Salinicola endophyticus]|uniref:DUF2244 domain-containing protein n=1 Tax=Salinicola endophyticus TaxID=1949083 RepID=A0ABY8FQB6_9GAMM|nr:hypothetical protein [Salinicola endophyticus]WFF43371.1 hypothetical protein EVC62_18780 [Salinicola endophyticus]